MAREAVLYLLCGVSKALKLNAVPSRYHCNSESRYRDRANELTSGTEPLVSVWYAFSCLSVEMSPRLLSVIDSSTSCLLLSRFSIKNDDALDEVGAWVTVSFSCMIYRCRDAFTQVADGLSFDRASTQSKVQAVISSDAAFALCWDV